MRAACLAEPGRFELGIVDVPDGDVLVRVEGCGVCASSLPVWQGRPWFAYPLGPGEPGHEVWGELADGTRAAVLGGGGFAEWSAAAAAHVVPLPGSLDGLPFPGEALGCAVNVVRRSALRPAIPVAVVGMGFVGHAVAQLCRAAGVSVTELRRGDAPRGSFERVIECAGTQDALDVASGLVASGGTLVLAGYHQDGRRTVDLQSWSWRGIDVVNAHERDPAVVVDGIRAAVLLAVAGALDLEALVTHVFPLARLGDAFAAAATREPGFVKAWVRP
jgi:NADPH2:quinone reductase